MPALVRSVAKSRTTWHADSIEGVWSVISNPEMIPQIDQRLTLVETKGEHATPESGYVLRGARGTRSVELHYRVVEAVANESLSLLVTMKDKESGNQEARLRASADGTVLTWTTRAVAPLGTGMLSRTLMRREMRLWLKAVAALSSSSG